jgi:hypothetical protein
VHFYYGERWFLIAFCWTELFDTVTMARFFLSSTLFLSLLHTCIAKSLNTKRWEDFKPKHAWADVPKNWELVGPAPSDHELLLRIGLKQDRLDELISSLYEVSDPDHHRSVSFFTFSRDSF